MLLVRASGGRVLANGAQPEEISTMGVTGCFSILERDDSLEEEEHAKQPHQILSPHPP